MTQTNDDTNESPHAGLETPCTNKLDETEMQTQLVYEDGEEREVEREVRPMCGTTLTYEDHYVGMAGTTIARKHGYENDALKFRCPDCGGITYRCPVCSNDEAPTGWFIGESTQSKIACHNCNPKEAQRQMQNSRGGRF